MTKKCEECQGDLICNNDELICSACGLVDDTNIIDIKTEEKPNIKNRTFNKYFNSGYKKDLKESRYKIPRKIKEVLKYINELKGFVKEELPDDSEDMIFNKLIEITRKDYEEGLRKTLSKKAVVWSTLINLLYKEIELLDPKIITEPSDKEYKKRKIKYSIALDRLEEKDKETFLKAKKISANDLVKKAKYLTALNEDYSVIPIDLERIDPSLTKANNRGFHKLFIKGTYEEWSDEDLVWNWENTIRTESTNLVKSYVHQNLYNQYRFGDNKLKAKKREGLFCVCCYIVCKKYNLRVKPQEEWARFFGISPSTFDKIYKEMKELAEESF